MTKLKLQAVKGDYVDDSWKSGEAALRDQTPAYQEWKRLSGTPKETAKRRWANFAGPLHILILGICATKPFYSFSTVLF